MQAIKPFILNLKYDQLSVSLITIFKYRFYDKTKLFFFLKPLSLLICSFFLFVSCGDSVPKLKVDLATTTTPTKINPATTTTPIKPATTMTPTKSESTKTPTKPESINPPKKTDTTTPKNSISIDPSRFTSKQVLNNPNNPDSHSYAVYSVSFSPDGKLLASGNKGKELRSGSYVNTITIWDVSNGFTELKKLTGHSSWVNSVSFSPDGSKLASGSYDEKIIIWDVSNGYSLKEWTAHSDSINSVVFSPDGTLASGSVDKTIKIWDVSGNLLNTFAHSNSVNSVSFSPNGKLLASGSSAPSTGTHHDPVKIWDVSSGDVKTLTDAYSVGGVNSVVFSPDGKMLATGSGGVHRDYRIRIWDVSSGKLLNRWWAHSKPIRSVVFSPDGKMLVSGSRDNTIKIWKVFSNPNISLNAFDGSIEKGTLLKKLTEHVNWVHSVSFSKDGTLASGSADYRIRIWQAK